LTDGCAPRLLDQLQACIAGHFDVEHPTFQPSPTPTTNSAPTEHPRGGVGTTPAMPDAVLAQG